jgi:two-component system, chemotaxis family, response regulator Rcp1
MTQPHQMQILIVEDNRADAKLAAALIEETGFPTHITLISDGEEALHAMEMASKDKTLAPDLILLDINLPKRNGHEILEYIRERGLLEETFVAICSGSNSIEDMKRARRNMANAYLQKPIGHDEMEMMINCLRRILYSLNEGVWINGFYLNDLRS